MTKTASSCGHGFDVYYFHNSNDFRSILDGGWLRLTRDFHPLRVSQITLFACDGSRPNEAVSTLGLRLGKRIIVLIYGSWPQARHSLLCARWPLALYLLSYGGVLASSLPHGFSFRAVYQTYPVDLFNYQTVASPHRPAVGGGSVPNGNDCRNVAQIETHFKMARLGGSSRAA